MPADGDRRVAYVCALAYVEPGGREEIVHGRCEGQLAHEPRGEGGFGYDPAFVPDDYPGDERTMAELTPEEKDAISHRGRAARALVLRLLQADEAARPAGSLRSLLGGAGRAPPAGTHAVNAVDDRAAGELADARARRRTAMVSVAAAVFLVAVKLVTGLATGSLAFLAEAVHSGTDLVAALLTLFAVQVARAPARPRAPVRARQGRAPRRAGGERVPDAGVAGHRGSRRCGG